MKEYMKPTMLIIMLNAEDIITTSNGWQQSNVEENEQIWEDFYK